MISPASNKRSPARACLILSHKLCLKLLCPAYPIFIKAQKTGISVLSTLTTPAPGNFSERKRLLAEIRAAERGSLLDFVERMLERLEDGCIKMYLTMRALNFRRARHELFATGDYQPLCVSGSRKNHVIAFSRNL